MPGTPSKSTIQRAKLREEINQFAKAVAAFQISPKVRYQFNFQGVRYAAPSLGSELMNLFKIINLELLQKHFQALSSEAKTQLKTSLMELTHRIKKVEAQHTLDDYRNAPRSELKAIQAVNDAIDHQRFESLEHFSRFVANGHNKHLLYFRNFFPVSPDVYDNISIITRKRKRDIALVKDIANNINGIVGKIFEVAFFPRGNCQLLKKTSTRKALFADGNDELKSSPETEVTRTALQSQLFFMLNTALEGHVPNSANVTTVNNGVGNDNDNTEHSSKAVRRSLF